MSWTLIFLVCLSTANILAQKKPAVTSEQTVFTAKDSDVKKPVGIPEDVMEALRKDQAVSAIAQSQNLSPEDIPAMWFTAAPVHLSASGQGDLVVVGGNPIAKGGVTTFWVFRMSPQGHQLVLTEPARGLALKSTRTNGFRDIELLSAAAVRAQRVLMQFDGKSYRMSREAFQAIR